MLNFRIVVCGVLCISRSLCFESIDGNEGSKCQHSGMTGLCKQVKDCPLALSAVKRGERHNLERCGFVGFEEVVCCPQALDRSPLVDSTTTDQGVVWTDNEIPRKDPPKQRNETNDGSTDVDNKGRINAKRKCEKACEKYIKMNDIKPQVDFHIIGGEDARLGEFPHMAALGFEADDDSGEALDWRLCAASLISSKFLLTAAHCFVNTRRPVLRKVRMGVVNLRRDKVPPEDYDTLNTTIHPKYNTRTRHNDIAVVELSTRVKTSQYIQPACLYTEDDDPLGLIISGWGQIVAGIGDERATQLQKATLAPVSISQCNITLLSKSIGTSKIIVASQICAWSDTSDTCQGDSGGPLQIQKKDGSYAIVGIVSYGAGCGGKTPGVYTRVSRFLNWIETVVWPD
ncbi:serine protease persephone-like isoform X2 [Cylas formicarius]|uniref:serine protease persephone-like isoform X2 n=1 Tax=Cylas formicarius TaxID=197179 RepID=UPI0029583C59|nr:serine protease persephone-like isoform X2 [Cylas formicarius]